MVDHLMINLQSKIQDLEIKHISFVSNSRKVLSEHIQSLKQALETSDSKKLRSQISRELRKLEKSLKERSIEDVNSYEKAQALKAAQSAVLTVTNSDPDLQLEIAEIFKDLSVVLLRENTESKKLANKLKEKTYKLQSLRSQLKLKEKNSLANGRNQTPIMFRAVHKHTHMKDLRKNLKLLALRHLGNLEDAKVKEYLNEFDWEVEDILNSIRTPSKHARTARASPVLSDREDYLKSLNAENLSLKNENSELRNLLDIYKIQLETVEKNAKTEIFTTNNIVLEPEHPKDHEEINWKEFYENEIKTYKFLLESMEAELEKEKNRKQQELLQIARSMKIHTLEVCEIQSQNNRMREISRLTELLEVSSAEVQSLQIQRQILEEDLRKSKGTLDNAHKDYEDKLSYIDRKAFETVKDLDHIKTVNDKLTANNNILFHNVQNLELEIKELEKKNSQLEIDVNEFKEKAVVAEFEKEEIKVEFDLLKTSFSKSTRMIYPELMKQIDQFQNAIESQLQGLHERLKKLTVLNRPSRRSLFFISNSSGQNEDMLLLRSELETLKEDIEQRKCRESIILESLDEKTSKMASLIEENSTLKHIKQEKCVISPTKIPRASSMGRADSGMKKLKDQLEIQRLAFMENSPAFLVRIVRHQGNDWLYVCSDIRGFWIQKSSLNQETLDVLEESFKRDFTIYASIFHERNSLSEKLKDLCQKIKNNSDSIESSQSIIEFIDNLDSEALYQDEECKDGHELLVKDCYRMKQHLDSVIQKYHEIEAKFQNAEDRLSETKQLFNQLHKTIPKTSSPKCMNIIQSIRTSLDIKSK